MAPLTNSLENLRSTRTRIAKLPSRQAQPAPLSEPPAETDARDFAKHLGSTHPLRVVFVGHNPSAESWARCAPYAHKSNRFWPLLRECGLVPPALCEAYKFAELPAAVGVGFIDLFITSGSDASLVGMPGGASWRELFFQRLRDGTDGRPPSIICPVSKIVAQKLLVGWRGDYGPAGFGKDWELAGAEDSQVWVLPSTSGRAGLKWEQRLEPFERLNAHIQETLPWPPQEEPQTAST